MKSLTGSGVTHLWTKIVEYVTGLGYTSNTGTVTGVTMNSGSTISPDANGVVDLGTVITSHQSLADYIQKAQTATGLLKDDGSVDTTAYGTGTLTGVSFNGTSATISNGVAAITATIPTVSPNTVVGSSQAYTIWVGDETAYGQETVNNNTIYIITES